MINYSESDLIVDEELEEEESMNSIQNENHNSLTNSLEERKIIQKIYPSFVGIN